VAIGVLELVTSKETCVGSGKKHGVREIWLDGHEFAQCAVDESHEKTRCGGSDQFLSIQTASRRELAASPLSRTSEYLSSIEL
jgi:hypothetical protein